MGRALMVGGTGPTGPHIVQGLADRGYEVTVFHRGTHETPELPPVRHLHGDPHFRESIDAALAGERFDVVVAAYGRVRVLAEALAGRCDRFVGIGGVATYRGAMVAPNAGESVMPLLAAEDSPTNDPDATAPADFGQRVRDAEIRTFQLHQEGAFSATYLRYPSIYGPRQQAPSEWSVIKRVRDGRRFMILPDSGLLVFSRAAARNAAHAVLLAVDHPTVAAGRVYNCADDELSSLRQWMEAIVDVMGGEMAMLSLPFELATVAHGLARAPAHVVVDTSRIRRELGYRDVVTFREAMGEAIAWYEANPVTADEYPWLSDAFDYENEDRFVAAYERALTGLRELAPRAPEFVHPYAHPRGAGKARDHRNR